MTHENPLILIGIGSLVINGLIGINVNMQIRRLLKVLYPEISEKIWDQGIMGSSINNSLTLMKIIINPPSEITYGPLLRLFMIWKIQIVMQIVLLFAITLCGLFSPKY